MCHRLQSTKQREKQDNKLYLQLGDISWNTFRQELQALVATSDYCIQASTFRRTARERRATIVIVSYNTTWNTENHKFAVSKGLEWSLSIHMNLTNTRVLSYTTTYEEITYRLTLYMHYFLVPKSRISKKLTI